MKSSTIDKIIAILAAIGGVLEIVVSFAYWGVKSLFIPGITVVPLSAVGCSCSGSAASCSPSAPGAATAGRATWV
jgi:hypothetical protein